MNTAWKATVHPRTWSTKLIVTDEHRDEILKASLPTPPGHPRALLTLLEGLALWSDHPLAAAICVGPSCGPLPDAEDFGAPFTQVGSALVRLHVVDDRARRPRRLTGLGDFQQLRLLHRRHA